MRFLQNLRFQKTRTLPLRIMLTQPPFARLLQSNVYLTLPLGPMLVASMLKQRGHEVVIYHDDASNPAPIPAGPVCLGQVTRRALGEECYAPFLAALEDFAPDVVGMSYRTVDADAVHDLAGFVRQRGIRLVAGGIHPSLLPEEEIKVFDAVVVGEGDHPQAAAAFEDFGTEIVRVPFMEDLDAVCADRGCVIGGERYSPFLTGMIETQRGCPYACSYCAAPTVFGKRVRMRDPGAVREEVESLHTKQGRIIDDSFGVVRQHGLAVCRELAKTGFRWVCDAALQNIDQELCEALRAGGCRRVNIGLESGSPRWRELSGKRVGPGQAEATLETAKRAGLGVVFYWIIGFPGETAEELQATLRWAAELKARGAIPCISTLTPYPGTKVWEMTEGLRDDSQGWAGYFHQSATQGFADVTADQWLAATREADRLNG